MIRQKQQWTLLGLCRWPLGGRYLIHLITQDLNGDLDQNVHVHTQKPYTFIGMKKV